MIQPTQTTISPPITEANLPIEACECCGHRPQLPVGLLCGSCVAEIDEDYRQLAERDAWADQGYGPADPAMW